MNYKTYFTNLNQQLQQYKRAIPFLLIDIDILDENVNLLKQFIPSRKAFRLVVKSLPVVELIQYLQQKIPVNNFMVFHQPFLSQLVNMLDEKASILLGKPMPIKTVQYFYNTFLKEGNFNPFTQIQWLVDDVDRLNNYLHYAKTIKNAQKHCTKHLKHPKHPIKINLEIDVGLHRGGFKTLKEIKAALQIISNNKEYLSFSGFMGYDPHIPKLPNFIISQKKAFTKANNFYKTVIRLVRNEFADLWSDNLTFNGAGSPTLNWHNNNESVLNDIAAGSILLKPGTFDYKDLKQFKPACFIATPVIKHLKKTTLPGLERFANVLPILKKQYQNTYFTYGGAWLANYFYPKDLCNNAVFGLSTNQNMLNAPGKVELSKGDFVFLRPQQSEFVLLQFGKVLIVKDGLIANEWMPFSN